MSILIHESDIAAGLQESVSAQTHVQFHGVLESCGEDFLLDRAELRVRGKKSTSETEALSLTGRESEILTLLGKGLSVKGIARVLDNSPGTVKWHVKNIYTKLAVGSREDALQKARRRKIIPL